MAIISAVSAASFAAACRRFVAAADAFDSVLLPAAVLVDDDGVFSLLVPSKDAYGLYALDIRDGPSIACWRNIICSASIFWREDIDEAAELPEEAVRGEPRKLESADKLDPESSCESAATDDESESGVEEDEALVADDEMLSPPNRPW